MENAIKILLIINIFWLISCDDNSDSTRKANKPVWNETFADILKRDLLISYDKFARPTQHNNTTSVIVDLQLKHFDLDEAASVFTIYAWFSMQWNDDKLKWNATNYGNLTKLILAQHEIWEPDIRSYNGINQDNFYGNSNFYVKADGVVTWIPPTMFKILCASDLRYWPYDTHNCELRLGSWVHDGNELDIHARKPNMKFEWYTENPEWEVKDLVAGREVSVYDCCPDEPYVTIRYNVTITRRASIYRHVIIAPAFVIITLTLITFWLPATYGEKIVLNGVTVVMIVLFLLYFSQKLNIMATHTPLIVMFYSNSLYLVCFSTLISVIVINLTRVRTYRPLPQFIKSKLDGKLGDYLLLDLVTEIESEPQSRAAELHSFDEHVPVDDHQLIQQPLRSKLSTKNDYVRLASAVDRIAFIFTLLLFLILSIAYSL